MNNYFLFQTYDTIPCICLYSCAFFLFLFLTWCAFMFHSNSMRHNFVVLELVALIFTIIAMSTWWILFYWNFKMFYLLFMFKSTWKKMVLKDSNAVQAIYHLLFLTTLNNYDNLKINYQNVTGYDLQMNSKD